MAALRTVSVCLLVILILQTAEVTWGETFPTLYGLAGNHLNLRCDPSVPADEFTPVDNAVDYEWEVPQHLSDERLTIEKSNDRLKIPVAPLSCSGVYSCTVRRDGVAQSTMKQEVVVVTPLHPNIYKKFQILIPEQECQRSGQYTNLRLMGELNRVFGNIDNMIKYFYYSMHCTSGKEMRPASPNLPIFLNVKVFQMRFDLHPKTPLNAVIEGCSSPRAVIEECVRTLQRLYDDGKQRLAKLLVDTEGYKQYQAKLLVKRLPGAVTMYKQGVRNRMTCKAKGFYRDQESLVCLPCTAGNRYDLGAHKCSSCPAATYQDEYGQTSCKPCPSGAVNEDRTQCTGESQALASTGMVPFAQLIPKTYGLEKFTLKLQCNPFPEERNPLPDWVSIDWQVPSRVRNEVRVSNGVLTFQEVALTHSGLYTCSVVTTARKVVTFQQEVIVLKLPQKDLVGRLPMEFKSHMCKDGSGPAVVAETIQNYMCPEFSEKVCDIVFIPAVCDGDEYKAFMQPILPSDTVFQNCLTDRGVLEKVLLILQNALDNTVSKLKTYLAESPYYRTKPQQGRNEIEYKTNKKWYKYAIAEPGQTCTKGYELGFNQLICVPCRPGFYSPSPGSACQECVKPQYSLYGMDRCQKCEQTISETSKRCPDLTDWIRNVQVVRVTNPHAQFIETDSSENGSGELPRESVHTQYEIVENPESVHMQYGTGENVESAGYKVEKFTSAPTVRTSSVVSTYYGLVGVQLNLRCDPSVPAGDDDVATQERHYTWQVPSPAEHYLVPFIQSKDLLIIPMAPLECSGFYACTVYINGLLQSTIKQEVIMVMQLHPNIYKKIPMSIPEKECVRSGSYTNMRVLGDLNHVFGNTDAMIKYFYYGNMHCFNHAEMRFDMHPKTPQNAIMEGKSTPKQIIQECMDTLQRLYDEGKQRLKNLMIDAEGYTEAAASNRVQGFTSEIGIYTKTQRQSMSCTRKGLYMDTTKVVCLPCKAGSRYDQGQQKCVACSQSTYQDEYGALSCKPCTNGLVNKDNTACIADSAVGESVNMIPLKSLVARIFALEGFPVNLYCNPGEDNALPKWDQMEWEVPERVANDGTASNDILKLKKAASKHGGIYTCKVVSTSKVELKFVQELIVLRRPKKPLVGNLPLEFNMVHCKVQEMSNRVQQHLCPDVAGCGIQIKPITCDGNTYKAYMHPVIPPNTQFENLLTDRDVLNYVFAVLQGALDTAVQRLVAFLKETAYYESKPLQGAPEIDYQVKKKWYKYALAENGQTCTKGYELGFNQLICVPCRPGFYSPSPGSACEACVKPQYSLYAATRCRDCTKKPTGADNSCPDLKAWQREVKVIDALNTGPSAQNQGGMAAAMVGDYQYYDNPEQQPTNSTMVGPTSKKTTIVIVVLVGGAVFVGTMVVSAHETDSSNKRKGDSSVPSSSPWGMEVHLTKGMGCCCKKKKKPTEGPSSPDQHTTMYQLKDKVSSYAHSAVSQPGSTYHAPMYPHGT